MFHFLCNCMCTCVASTAIKCDIKVSANRVDNKLLQLLERPSTGRVGKKVWAGPSSVRPGLGLWDSVQPSHMSLDEGPIKKSGLGPSSLFF